MSCGERNLLRSLINAAEKAANIARVCRSNNELLALLVQEKSGGEANARFDHDFKTLADVLIQETIKHDVGAEFPEMHDNIKGEESPSFTNATGENVAIAVGETPGDTESCLLQVLKGEHREAAEILAAEVHRQVQYAQQLEEELPEMPNDVDYSQLGVWIDPIDATNEYISGDTIFTNFPGITSTGLDCVTILIGVYDLTSGTPVMGIVSQPFRNKLAENSYSSSLFWGVALPNLQAHSKQIDDIPCRSSRLGIFSSSEKAEILKHMSELGYQFAFSAGAGHKALKVITKEVDIYVLSKGSTFMWDTCAPQAILRALGGDIFEFKTSVREGKAMPLRYLALEDSETEGDWKCNRHGLIAVRDVKLLDELLLKFSNSEL